MTKENQSSIHSLRVKAELEVRQPNLAKHSNLKVIGASKATNQQSSVPTRIRRWIREPQIATLTTREIPTQKDDVETEFGWPLSEDSTDGPLKLLTPAKQLFYSH